MKITLIHSMAAITLEDIQKFESQKNIKLPKQYQDFLLKYNGGVPDMGAFDYYDSDVERWNSNIITQFFGLNKTSDYPTGGIIIHGLRDNIFEGMLPIAITSTSDLICINVAGENAGDIHLWKHSYDITIRIADDFDSFINSLSFLEDPDDEEE